MFNKILFTSNNDNNNHIKSCKFFPKNYLEVWTEKILQKGSLEINVTCLK